MDPAAGPYNPSNDARDDADRVLDAAASLFAHAADIVAILGPQPSPGRILRGGERRSEALVSPLGLFEPTAAAEIERAADQVIAEGKPLSLDAAMSFGGVFQVSLSPAPAIGQGAVLLVGSDISARKKLEERLRRSEALMVDTYGVAHLGTWEWDVTEPTARWSDELYRIYALTPETYTPSYEAYLQMVHPEDRDYVREATERVFREHVPYSHDERILRPDGTIRHLHTWAYPILEDGKLVRLVGVCQDITDRKCAEIALAERAAELTRINERLRAEMAERERVEAQLRDAHKLEAIGRLAGGIAHDFNNLLSVVLGRSGLLERSLPAGDPLRQHAVEIVEVSRQAARLTHQLLLFSREQVARHEVFEFGAVVSELAQMLRRLVGEDVELETEIADGEHFVEADRSQIEQVVMNLVVNARDALPKGGRITVKVGAASTVDGNVRLPTELDPEAEHVVLCVADDGIGMDDTTLAKIFDPYFTTKLDGHGLGLSTVYGIVRKLNGSISVTSSLGKGSRFLVFLPRTDRRAVSSRAGASVDIRGSATLLVVEDQSSVLRVVKEQLEELGYNVLEAATPSEAIEVRARTTSRIHLLLTDVVMPQMNGVELAKQLQAQDPDMQVLFMSGWANQALVAELEGANAPILRKPFTMQQLSLAVRAALRGLGPRVTAALQK